MDSLPTYALWIVNAALTIGGAAVIVALILDAAATYRWYKFQRRWLKATGRRWRVYRN
jgi:hypothetical protein